MAQLNLFPLLVQEVFGSVFLALLAVGLLLVLIAMFSRQSQTTMRFIIIAYILAASMGYMGSVGALVLFILGGIYFSFQFVGFMQRTT